MLQLLLSLLVHPAFAITTKIVTPTVIVSPTDMPTPTPTNTDEIEKVRELVKQKVQAFTNPNLTSKKGLIGEVISTDSKTISIKYLDTISTLNIDSSTVYVDGNRSKAKLENIKVGQGILALGVNDTNGFSAKRIITMDLSTIAQSKTVVIGKIVSISSTANILALIPTKNKNNTYQIKTDTKSEVIDKNQQKISLTSLKSGQKIIAVLLPDPKTSKTYYAVSIYDLDATNAPSTTPTPSN